jgi:hypothetical protein
MRKRMDVKLFSFLLFFRDPTIRSLNSFAFIWSIRFMGITQFSLKNEKKEIYFKIDLENTTRNNNKLTATPLEDKTAILSPK